MNLTRLTYCAHNQKVKVVEIDGGVGAVQNINSFGIKIGDEIILKSRKNGRDKITVEYNNSEISFGHELASKIIMEIFEEPVITLNQIKIDDIVEITKMKAKGDIRFRLLDMGIVKGVQLSIVRVAPLGDPIEVLINGFNLSLRIEEAKGIEVKLIELKRSKRNGKKRWGIFRN